MIKNKTFKKLITVLWFLTIFIIILTWVLIADRDIEHVIPFTTDYGDRVDVTVFAPREAETDSHPLSTASGFVIDPDSDIKLVSVSRDLLDCYPYGTVIYIDSDTITKLYGNYFIVLDCMNSRYTKTIDILVKETDPLNKWTDVHIAKL